MPFSVVSWNYRDEATSAKLAQMVENLRLHDHRSDGTQGAALVGAWKTATTAVAATGWTLSSLSKRYRLLLGGRLVEYDFRATRTGGNIVGNVTGSGLYPGQTARTTIFTGLPTEARTPEPQTMVVNNSNLLVLETQADGSLDVIASTSGGGVATNDTFSIRGLVWIS